MGCLGALLDASWGLLKASCGTVAGVVAVAVAVALALASDFGHGLRFGCGSCFGWNAKAMTCPEFLALTVGLVWTVALALAEGDDT